MAALLASSSSGKKIETTRNEPEAIRRSSPSRFPGSLMFDNPWYVVSVLTAPSLNGLRLASNASRLTLSYSPKNSSRWRSRFSTRGLKSVATIGCVSLRAIASRR